MAERRLALRVRSALLREKLVLDVRGLSPIWTGTNRIHQGVHWIRRHPVGLGVAVAALVAWRPRQTLSAAWRFWGWWQAGRRWLKFLFE